MSVCWQSLKYFIPKRSFYVTHDFHTAAYQFTLSSFPCKEWLFSFVVAARPDGVILSSFGLFHEQYQWLLGIHESEQRRDSLLRQILIRFILMQKTRLTNSIRFFTFAGWNFLLISSTSLWIGQSKVNIEISTKMEVFEKCWGRNTAKRRKR